MKSRVYVHESQFARFCRRTQLDSLRSFCQSGMCARYLRRPVARAIALILLSLGAMELIAQPAPPPNFPDYSQPAPYPKSGSGQFEQNGQQQYPAYAPQQSPQQNYGAGYGQVQPLPAEQLEQLAAPIALYPDALVAQILTASTYPAEVVQADRWLEAQGYASPDQIAAGADQQSWDPSVKALTALPQVLAQMDRNLGWTTDLGNAYYNQPQDVLESIQILRQRAQAAGNLHSTAQETVSYDQGSIAVAPPNPQVIYVPAYNPWTVYGQPLTPYPGFSLLGAIGSVLGASGSILAAGTGSFLGASPISFGSGILLSAFSRAPWGFLGWALNWLNLSVLFLHSNYYTHSTTVADWGLPHGGRRAAFEARSVAGLGAGPYHEQPSYGRPADIRTPQYSRAYNRSPRPEGFRSSPNGYAGNRPEAGAGRGYSSPLQGAQAGRPQEAYNRVQPLAGGSSYGRSAYGQGYGSGFYGSQAQGYPGRTGSAYYRSPEPPNRPPASGFEQRTFGRQPSGGFQNRAFSGNSLAAPKSDHSSGFHLFGGNHQPKSFGSSKGFSSKHFGGGGHSGGHGGGKHLL